MSSVEEISVPLDKITTFCRLCLTVNDNLYQIFRSDETEALAIPLSMKVSLCTAITISKNDMLPQKICHNCLNYINEWYLFRIKCKKVNSFLKRKFSLQSTNQNGKEKTISDGENFQETSENKEDKETFSALTNSELPQLESKTNEVDNDLNCVESNLDVFQKSSLNENTVQEKIIQSQCDLSLIMRKKKFKCTLCPDSFYYLKDLKIHKAFIHNYVKSDNMSKKVATLADPDIRLEGINIRTRYEMKCCDKVFFNKLRFRRHYSEKHPGEKPFMCETCGKKDFISEETLKRHKVLHTGKFRCEICLKTFTCNAILILHKRDKHENDRPFICDVCGKRFVTELLMNYHKRFHTGEKKYVCEECGLAVVTSSSLAKHKRIHSKEKPHVCHMCGKGFIIKGRLIEHLRIHTGERPYECQICQKGFTMKDKLKRHIRIHSGEKLFSCEYCGNNYSTRYGLSIHLKSHVAKCS